MKPISVKVNNAYEWKAVASAFSALGLDYFRNEPDFKDTSINSIFTQYYDEYSDYVVIEKNEKSNLYITFGSNHYKPVNLVSFMEAIHLIKTELEKPKPIIIDISNKVTIEVSDKVVFIDNCINEMQLEMTDIYSIITAHKKYIESIKEGEKMRQVVKTLSKTENRKYNKNLIYVFIHEDNRTYRLTMYKKQYIWVSLYDNTSLDTSHYELEDAIDYIVDELKYNVFVFENIDICIDIIRHSYWYMRTDLNYIKPQKNISNELVGLKNISSLAVYIARIGDGLKFYKLAACYGGRNNNYRWTSLQTTDTHYGGGFASMEDAIEEILNQDDNVYEFTSLAELAEFLYKSFQ